MMNVFKNLMTVQICTWANSLFCKIIIILMHSVVFVVQSFHVFSSVTNQSPSIVIEDVFLLLFSLSDIKNFRHPELADLEKLFQISQKCQYLHTCFTSSYLCILN